MTSQPSPPEWPSRTPDVAPLLRPHHQPRPCPSSPSHFQILPLYSVRSHLQTLSPQGAHLAVIDALMVAFALEWTKTLPSPLALASLEHKLLFWVDTVGGAGPGWAGGQGCPVTRALTPPGPPDNPAAAGEDGAGSGPESIACGACRWGGPSAALGEARAIDGRKDRQSRAGWAERAIPALRVLEVTLSVFLPLPPRPPLPCACSSHLCLSGLSAPHAGTGSWFL